MDEAKTKMHSDNYQTCTMSLSHPQTITSEAVHRQDKNDFGKAAYYFVTRLKINVSFWLVTILSLWQYDWYCGICGNSGS